MNTMNSRKLLALISFFLVVTGSLFLLDYQEESDIFGKGVLSSILQTVFSRTSITPGLLSKTSLVGKNVIFEENNDDFFAEYLKLPPGITARHAVIEETTITLSEVKNGNPEENMAYLVQQKKESVEFNIIQEHAFYMNQIPLEIKTHNFLGIVIRDVLYGFQYKPFDHSKVLELVDALSQSE